LQLFGLQSNPCIANFQTESHILVRVTQACHQMDGPPLCEFDGVSHQIEQNLSQPNGVGRNFGGEIILALDNQRQPLLLGARHEPRRHLPNEVDRRNRTRARFRLPRFQTRHLQNIVHHRHQLRGIPVNGTHRLSESKKIRAVVIRQQIDVAKNRRERCADFVADVRQELPFGEVGGFGLHAGAGEFLGQGVELGGLRFDPLPRPGQLAGEPVQFITLVLLFRELGERADKLLQFSGSVAARDPLHAKPSINTISNENSLLKIEGMTAAQMISKCDQTQ